MITPEIPESQRVIPWVQTLVGLIQEQAKTIQEQAKTIQTQVEQITHFQATVQELRDEITRLKNTPKRPNFRPSGAPNKDAGSKGSATPKPPVVSQNTSPKKVKEEIIVKLVEVPEGSRFKGYTTYSVQDVVLIAKDMVYKLEVWQAPDGSTIRAKLPSEVDGSHFGADLRAMIHGLYASGMTQPAIFQFISNTGIEISEGQIHHILMGEAQTYREQSEAILAAGLQEAPYIRVDDTGAVHARQNGYCTHIGGEYFAYYKTTASKSRLNFLTMLAQGQEGYIINDAFIWHLFGSGIKDDILNTFEAYKGKHYRTKRGFLQLVNDMGLSGKKLQCTCLEAGLVGFIQENLLKSGQVLLSDRAGQFAIFDHADCWVHMERPLRKLVASTPAIEEEIREVRNAIWNLYRQVQEASITQKGKEQVIEAYDALIMREVVSPGVRDVLDAFRTHREGLLKALDHPGLPLHNNDSERDIRGMVKFRNISGGTKSEEGKCFRDGLMTIKQTCYRLGENFWEYLRSWFRKAPLDLAACIRQRYRTAPATSPP